MVKNEKSLDYLIAVGMIFSLIYIFSELISFWEKSGSVHIKSDIIKDIHQKRVAMINKTIHRKLLPNTEKLFRYSVKMYWLYRKTFLFDYQYRQTFSVIYAETINRKTEYKHEDGCALSTYINRKTFSVNVLCVQFIWTGFFKQTLKLNFSA